MSTRLLSQDDASGRGSAAGPSPSPGSGLSAENITVIFGRGERAFTAVDDVSLEVAPGEIVGLVGESGSGKSTVSRVICGLQRDYSGGVSFDGRELGPKRSAEQWRVVQMVFQDPFASLDPRYTVRNTLTEVIRHHKLASGAALKRRCVELMDMVRLPVEFLDRTPTAMSGGQRQRVAIARALAVQPEAIVADEAVSALDVSVQAEIIALFARLREQLDLSILFISHDLAVVRSLCERVCVIHNGVLVESSSTAEIFDNPREEYTKSLLRAIPRFDSAFLDRGAGDPTNDPARTPTDTTRDSTAPRRTISAREGGR
ncbi:ABC transporter ATP-binding protein [Brevibacterium marinum]|uniref:ABC-type glutathione transport system ATPase component n=1 Tax=Brevibacterium marinum TaxID=418643 RepID=A0A846S0L0_9MICO|nr:ABC transporter ATP-binding protein [Brevibacterium marinum]NJC55731.1 ABC-type glutathione transport system ATPase component [Brevibacterium marinum]